METGNIITNLRKEKDWSQADLANKSGVSREMIGKYERGEAVPSIEAAKKLLMLLKFLSIISWVKVSIVSLIKRQ